MGASQSSQSVKQTVNVVNSAMNNMVSNNTTSATAKTINSNNINVKLGNARITGCNINIGQKIKAEQNVKMMAKYTNVTDLQNEVKTALKNEVKQLSSTEIGALSGSLSIQNNEQSIDQYITNTVTNNVTQNVLNELNAYLDNANKGEYDLSGLVYTCKGNQSLTITQDIVSTQTAQMLSNAVIGNKVKDTSETSAAAKGEQEAKSKLQGAISAVLGPLAALIGGGIFAYAMIFICPVLMLCFCCAMCMMGRKKGSSPAPSTGAATAFGKKLKKALNSLKKM
jgi:hypothetical protein